MKDVWRGKEALSECEYLVRHLAECDRVIERIESRANEDALNCRIVTGGRSQSDPLGQEPAISIHIPGRAVIDEIKAERLRRAAALEKYAPLLAEISKLEVVE